MNNNIIPSNQRTNPPPFTTSASMIPIANNPSLYGNVVNPNAATNAAAVALLQNRILQQQLAAANPLAYSHLFNNQQQQLAAAAAMNAHAQLVFQQQIQQMQQQQQQHYYQQQQHHHSSYHQPNVGSSPHKSRRPRTSQSSNFHNNSVTPPSSTVSDHSLAQPFSAGDSPSQASPRTPSRPFGPLSHNSAAITAPSATPPPLGDHTTTNIDESNDANAGKKNKNKNKKKNPSSGNIPNVNRFHQPAVSTINNTTTPFQSFAQPSKVYSHNAPPSTPPFRVMPQSPATQPMMFAPMGIDLLPQLMAQVSLQQNNAASPLMNAAAPISPNLSSLSPNPQPIPSAASPLHSAMTAQLPSNASPRIHQPSPLPSSYTTTHNNNAFAQSVAANLNTPSFQQTANGNYPRILFSNDSSINARPPKSNNNNNHHHHHNNNHNNHYHHNNHNNNTVHNNIATSNVPHHQQSSAARTSNHTNTHNNHASTNPPPSTAPPAAPLVIPSVPFPPLSSTLMTLAPFTQSVLPDQKVREEYPPSPYFAIDVECVATGPTHNDRTIAQIAVVDQYERVILNVYIKPDKPIKSYLTALTGIDKQMCDNGVSLEYALSQIHLILPPDSVIVGQNILKDIEWLKLEEGRHFRHMLDLCGLYRVRHPVYQNWTMFSLHHEAKSLLNIQQGEPHNAVSDALLSVKLYTLYKQLEKNDSLMGFAHSKLLETEPEASFAKRYGEIEGVCLGHRKNCVCHAPFFG